MSIEDAAGDQRTAGARLDESARPRRRAIPPKSLLLSMN